MNEVERTILIQNTASGFAKILRQSYEFIDGSWWLLTLGKPVRELSEEEVQWHIDRNHAPFIKDGIDPDHKDWWKDPE